MQHERLLHFNSLVLSECPHAQSAFSSHGIEHSRAFLGLTLMGKRMTVDSLQKAFSIVSGIDGNDVVELMTHPGYPSDSSCSIHNCGCLGGDGPDSFSSSPDRLHELELLKSKEFHDLLLNFKQ